MPSNDRFVFISIHRVLVLMSVALLGLGWYIKYIPQEPEARSFLLNLHMSLGLTSAILISIQILLRIVFKPSSFPNYFPKWRKILAYTLYLLIYVSFTLMLVSGFLQSVFSALPISFWGAPLPAWGEADATLAGRYATVHGIAAFVLAGSILVHVGFGVLNIFKHPGIAAPMPPLEKQESQELVLDDTKSRMASKIAQRLAKKLRLFGWIGFWLQFVLAFISALLLAFATTGRAFSPGSAWFGDATYWGATDFWFCVLRSCWPSITREPPEKSFQDRILILNKQTGPPFGFWAQACSPVF